MNQTLSVSWMVWNVATQFNHKIALKIFCIFSPILYWVPKFELQICGQTIGVVYIKNSKKNSCLFKFGYYKHHYWIKSKLKIFFGGYGLNNTVSNISEGQPETIYTYIYVVFAVSLQHSFSTINFVLTWNLSGKRNEETRAVNMFAVAPLYSFTILSNLVIRG